jgi:hypothetical protein
MRCYNYSGFGHKSQECWNTRRKSMMRTSHSMARRRNEVRKGDIFEKMDAHSSSFKKIVYYMILTLFVAGFSWFYVRSCKVTM